MKKLILFLFAIAVSAINAQDIKTIDIKTEVKEVMVFLKDAQITRYKTLSLTPGTKVLKFQDLSPFIDAKSIRVKAGGGVTILSVNHQQNFIDKLEKQEELVALENKLKAVDEKLLKEEALLKVLKEELDFLKDNRKIGGKNEQLKVENLKQTANYYGARLKTLVLEKIELDKKRVELHLEKTDLTNQINAMSTVKKYPNGEILVKVKVKNAVKSKFEISYLVGNASWYPTYDIRAKNVNEPIDIVYKANVKQDTKIDWINVKLKFSSANPNVSGVAPELQPYYLNYHSLPPVYNRRSNNISGVVTDDQGPLPGVNVIVKGSTVGTTTDFDGKYSITVPNDAKELEFSFIGMVPQEVAINSSRINVLMEQDHQTLDEVVVVGYGKRSKKLEKSLSGKVSGVSIRGANSIKLPVMKVENQTTVNFEIDMPYTIKSDSKSYGVSMIEYHLPANYQYYSVPKIEPDAFLLANITNWEQYNLLEGEANIYFEGTYVGKTLLDVRYAKDTLQVSLGRDKSIVVKREKVKDFSSKRFIGSKKEEIRNWDITIKNNKSTPIDMLIFDQVPVSTLDEIKVETLELSGAKFNEENGELKWELKLQPSESKNLKLKYGVKYPKQKTLVLE